MFDHMYCVYLYIFYERVDFPHTNKFYVSQTISPFILFLISSVYDTLEIISYIFKVHKAYLALHYMTLGK